MFAETNGSFQDCLHSTVRCGPPGSAPSSRRAATPPTGRTGGRPRQGSRAREQEAETDQSLWPPANSPSGHQARAWATRSRPASLSEGLRSSCSVDAADMKLVFILLGVYDNVARDGGRSGSTR